MTFDSIISPQDQTIVAMARADIAVRLTFASVAADKLHIWLEQRFGSDSLQRTKV